MRNKIATLICGFAAGVLQITPLKSFACCLIIPAAAGLSLLLDQKAIRSTEPIETRKAVIFGLFTGLFAAFFATTFEIFITFITRHNDIISAIPDVERFWGSVQGGAMLENAMSLLNNIANDIRTTGFSPLYTIIIFVNNMLFNPIFGMLGGLIGMKIINNNLKKNKI